jgi:hypothetical protein
MAQPARVNHEERERQEEERKRRKKASQQLYNHRKTSDEGTADFAATAQMDSHATLLSQVSSAEQQAKLITQLQQSYGNAYVQRLIERIQAEKGSGRPLEPEARSEMEVAFKQDFGDVRVHTGATADKLTEELGAQAFTSGKDIFFRGSAYQPGSEPGRELLGHELTHVVQQEIGTQVGQMAIGQVGDTFEREATWAGQAVSEGREVSVETVSAVPALQRQLDGAAGALPEAAETAKAEAIGVVQEVLAMLLAPRPDFGAIVTRLTALLDIARRALTSAAGGAAGAVGGLLGRAAGAAGGLVGRIGGFLGGLFG